MSREAIKYTITLEREDGADISSEHSESFVSVSFRADNYLSEEYMRNFRDSILRMIEHEHNKHRKTKEV